MTLKDKIKDLSIQSIKLATSTFKEFTEQIERYAKCCEAENRLASVSSDAFVRAFSDTAKQICYCKTTPFLNNYLPLIDEAIEMLASGEEEAEVLWYFDILLQNERGGKE